MTKPFDIHEEHLKVIAMVSRLADAEGNDLDPGIHRDQKFCLRLQGDESSRTFEWKTEPASIFGTPKLFDSLTSAWMGEVQESGNRNGTASSSGSERLRVVCKNVWLKRDLADYEGGLLRIANEKRIAGVPKLIAHSIVQEASGGDVSVESIHGSVAYHDAQDILFYVCIVMASADSKDFFRASTLELLEGARDIARALWSLWSKCQIRHRDVSINDVKIAVAHRTLANLERLRTKDLELNTPEETRLSAELLDLGNAVRQGLSSGQDCRSGTLAFMSIGMGQLLSLELVREYRSEEEIGNYPGKVRGARACTKGQTQSECRAFESGRVLDKVLISSPHDWRRPRESVLRADIGIGGAAEQDGRCQQVDYFVFTGCEVGCCSQWCI